MTEDSVREAVHGIQAKTKEINLITKSDSNKNKLYENIKAVFAFICLRKESLTISTAEDGREDLEGLFPLKHLPLSRTSPAPQTCRDCDITGVAFYGGPRRLQVEGKEKDKKKSIC